MEYDLSGCKLIASRGPLEHSVIQLKTPLLNVSAIMTEAFDFDIGQTAMTPWQVYKEVLEVVIPRKCDWGVD